MAQYSTEAIIFMLAYSLASSSLLLINKLCLYHLPAPSFISALQFISAGVTAMFLMATGIVPRDAWEMVKFKAYAYYVCMFVATIYCNMKVSSPCLALSSILRSCWQVMSPLPPRL